MEHDRPSPGAERSANLVSARNALSLARGPSRDGDRGEQLTSLIACCIARADDPEVVLAYGMALHLGDEQREMAECVGRLTGEPVRAPVDPVLPRAHRVIDLVGEWLDAGPSPPELSVSLARRVRHTQEAARPHQDPDLQLAAIVADSLHALDQAGFPGGRALARAVMICGDEGFARDLFAGVAVLLIALSVPG